MPTETNMEPVRGERVGVFFAALIIALGGIIYELIIGTVSSYLLGDSVLQFSLTIGFMLFGMGLGSLAAPRLAKAPESAFVTNECLIAFVGGNAPAAMFWIFNRNLAVEPVFFAVVIALGVLIGLEIPLMFSILKSKGEGTLVLSRILSLDYLGALLASLLFPLVLLPKLGLLRTAYVIGLMNAAIAGVIFVIFRRRIRYAAAVGAALAVTTAILAGGTLYANRMAAQLEQGVYRDQIILSEQTAYQKIVITRFKDDVRLFLNTNLQFSSVDEYRYHEPLVHLPLGSARRTENILVLGGGDGLAAREILKYPSVKRLTLVDLDSRMTRLAAEHPLLSGLNKNSFADPRVRIVNADAFSFLREASDTYDVILADLPDPNDESLAKLYSQEFYALAKHHLAEDGYFMTQATSPYFSNRSFWSIFKTVESAGFSALAVHVQVPSFGEWGFVLASPKTPPDPTRVKIGVPTRFLTDEVLPTLFVFDGDIKERGNAEVSSLMHPSILGIYLEEAKNWRE